MTRDSAVTLLFVHGGGFCKNCWDPIVRRLKAAPQLAGADFVTFDFKWHGINYDHSEPAQVDRSNPEKPRVNHPAKGLTTWAPQQVWEQVQKIRAGQRARGQSDKTPAIGVGHSMGAMALWKTEVMHPGTFASLSLFEPGYGIRTPQNDFTVDFLVALTLQREAKWPTRLAAEDHFYDLKNFARWDREALAGYLRGGLIDEQDGSVILACHPLIEASLYCHTPMNLSDELQQRPRCRINFHGGARSKIHNGKEFGEMATKYPQIYRTRPLMPGLSHALVMENPADCAKGVLADLNELIPAGRTTPQSRM
ncbi:putative serine protease family S33 [Phytophthora cinnamomi]|uniref:putative serine protease family S33 n=1 Tax=Phytophthora cinnamomi TaxID=4785 RepID=UPI003559B937|nr:putative serine protease family S33 [Phytophthora cinnamomi]